MPRIPSCVAPVASPSRPSVRFTALLVPTIMTRTQSTMMTVGSLQSITLMNDTAGDAGD